MKQISSPKLFFIHNFDKLNYITDIMSFNTFGKFLDLPPGKSHGPAIGCIIDGCPPNIQIRPEDIQELNKEGQGKVNLSLREKKRTWFILCLVYLKEKPLGHLYL